MERALKNLFREEEPTQRNVQVAEYLGNNTYRTVDVYGRNWIIKAEQKLSINGFVIIQMGRAVGAGHKFSPVEKIYV